MSYQPIFNAPMPLGDAEPERSWWVLWDTAPGHPSDFVGWIWTDKQTAQVLAGLALGRIPTTEYEDYRLYTADERPGYGWRSFDAAKGFRQFWTQWAWVYTNGASDLVLNMAMTGETLDGCLRHNFCLRITDAQGRLLQ